MTAETGGRGARKGTQIEQESITGPKISNPNSNPLIEAHPGK